MVGYKVLESDAMEENNTPVELSHRMIEKMNKIVSPHRAALDF